MIAVLGRNRQVSFELVSSCANQGIKPEARATLSVELGPLHRYDDLSGKTFLVCVGAMRCATSWMYHYLATIPEIAVSPLKELHFFSTKFPTYALSDMDTFAMKRLAFHMGQEGGAVRNLRDSDGFRASVDRVQMIYDDNAYFGHFSRICKPETRTFCDITPAYSVIGPSGFEYLKEFCASQDCKLKLMFIMRDPVDRLWSQLRHLQDINPTNVSLDRWGAALESLTFCARADYMGTVSDLATTFDEDDLLYLFYEELFSDATLRRLCAFAGVDFRPANVEDRVNAGQTQADMPEEVRAAFLHRLEMQYEFCRDWFGDAVPESWQA